MRRFSSEEEAFEVYVSEAMERDADDWWRNLDTATKLDIFELYAAVDDYFAEWQNEEFEADELRSA